MNTFLKIAIRTVPVLAVLVFAYIFYLNFYGDRSQNTWFGRHFSIADIKAESAKANAFFERYYDSVLVQHPELQSSLGIKTQQDKWNDLSEAAAQRKHLFAQKMLQQLRDSIRYESLDTVAQISYLLLENQLQMEVEGFQYRHFDYPVNQMHGIQSESVSLLLNMHRIDNEQDALAYIARLKGMTLRIDQLLEQLHLREEKGMIPPRFLFPKLLDDCNNIIAGFPYSPNPVLKNVLYEDFEAKINKVPNLLTEQRNILLANCRDALLQSVRPAYQKLIDYLKALEPKSNNAAGLWKVRGGDDCYIFRLREQTSSDHSPDAIYDLGNEEIQRIQEEMRAIMKQVQFKGELQDFFKFMRDSPQFYYPNTAAGKAEYLRHATAIIDSMRPMLPKIFYPHSMPKADIHVKSVEAYREKSAGKAFYEPPAADGSRPGTYYVNTYDMRSAPRYQMEALAYHEGIPGHHTQLALAQEMDFLPRFRRYALGYNAYVEGWGLYSELLPKELGFYKDPYADFGRLAMELWRACRLVVDVGIHAKRWTREQAIQFYKSNTPNSEADCIKMVDRHVVMPAQATTYKIGMIILLELRAKAKKELGAGFDIRDFHDVLLRNAALPLDILEDLVDAYIAMKKKK